MMVPILVNDYVSVAITDRTENVDVLEEMDLSCSNVHSPVDVIVIKRWKEKEIVIFDDSPDDYNEQVVND